MDAYKHILVAVDLSDDSQLICQKALEIAHEDQSRILLVHVTEFVYQMSTSYDPLFYPSMEDLAVDEEEILTISKNKMKDLINTLEVPKEGILENKVLAGIPKTEIIRLAKENCADLIVCGSHGRSGFELLLGSTANAILHHAPCDVLAVRTRKSAA